MAAGAATVTDLVTVSVLPSASVTVYVTAYVPAAAKMCNVPDEVLVLPSPKFQAKVSPREVGYRLVSVKTACCPGSGTVGSTAKSAVGPRASYGRVIVLVRPSAAFATSVTVYVPTTA